MEPWFGHLYDFAWYYGIILVVYFRQFYYGYILDFGWYYYGYILVFGWYYYGYVLDFGWYYFGYVCISVRSIMVMY